MPPIRPSGKKAKSQAAIYSTVALRLPKLSALAARCIALGCQIESLYGAILTTVLGANAAPAAAMYRSLQSLNAQLAVVQAAAKTVLNDDEMDVFHVIIKLCNRALKHRHRLAHWVWGHCDGYPDAILLIDPEALLESETGATSFMAPNEGRGLPEDFDLSSCLVYDEKSLNEAMQELAGAEYLLAQFRMLTIPSFRALEEKPDFQSLEKLKLQPAIAEGLLALEKHRRENPERPAQSRGRGRGK